jgi:hypothetical protein
MLLPGAMGTISGSVTSGEPDGLLPQPIIENPIIDPRAVIPKSLKKFFIIRTPFCDYLIL